jgi:hypothetical protein
LLDLNDPSEIDDFLMQKYEIEVMGWDSLPFATTNIGKSNKS